MNWVKFSSHGESNNRAFEIMCNQLFELWCKEEYENELENFVFVNGSGGDGGLESYGTLKNGDIIAVQAKWFRDKLQNLQFNQICNSFKTAMKVHPEIKKYIVCIPRDLGGKKVVKDGNIAENTEFCRWTKLCESLKSSNPDVELVLWDETTIQQKLTGSGVQGIYKYWFENTIVFDEQFSLSLERIKNGWANTKYIPEIYTEGYIHDKLELFLGSVELNKKRLNCICNLTSRFRLLIRYYQDLLELKKLDEDKDLTKKINNDISMLNKWIVVFEQNQDIVKKGGNISFIPETLGLTCSVDDIQANTLIFKTYFHCDVAKKTLISIDEEFYNLRRLLRQPDSNKILFLGLPGTGKTAGMIAEASKFLENKLHLPVIINAKSYSEDATWSSMITNSLGLEPNWNEFELLEALQNAACLKNCYFGEEYQVESNCVIMIDGIDEAKSWDFWRVKIQETEVYKKKFPRLKFVFFSRPYVFEDRYKLSYKDSILDIPQTGDANLEKICEKYFKKYNIDIQDNLWIKNNLKSPIAIRLFCDIYRGQPIHSLKQNMTVLTSLYKEKMKSLQKNYARLHNSKSGTEEVHNTLICLADLFAKNDLVQYKDICNNVIVRSIELDDLLDFYINEGFIYRYQKQKDEFSPIEEFFSWGIQPAFDYLIGQKVFKQVESGENLSIDNVNGVNQMFALISIENGKLITEYPNVKIKNDIAFKLICYALANCSIEVARKYSEYLKNQMNYSAERFRQIFSNVIQPVLKVDEHPLGSVLLDDFLRGFNKSADRDIWWSIPSCLTKGLDETWYSRTELEFSNINLNNTDKYNGAPLILAWSLSSLNNETRKSSRFKLIEWGMEQPFEFWKLFKKCISINDMQVLEDMFAIAYGIALDQFVCRDYLDVVSQWLLENIFSENGLRQYENVVLRYYAAGIVKIAIKKYIVDNSKLKFITPPYNYVQSELPVYKDALNSTRWGCCNGINYDLSRYVLCDGFNGFFRENYATQKYHEKAIKFIKKYEENLETSNLKVDGLIIAAAYQYILNQGWNPETFWVSDDNTIGIDMAIHHTYLYATHGVMSRVMSVVEKNVWLAKHYIEAIIANSIPLYKDGNYKFVDDYSQLDNYVNVYQDYVNKTMENNHDWFNVDLLVNTSFDYMDKNKIENWMKEENHQFSEWLIDKNNNVILYASTMIQNELSGVEESVSISTGVVNKVDFKRFLTKIENDFDDRYEFLDVCDFYTVQDCKCYCTPQEACLIHSKRELYRELIIPDTKSDIEVFKLVEKCLCSDELATERYFYLPSRLTRMITNIEYGNGFSYVNKEGKTVASYSADEKNFESIQRILRINGDYLNSSLEKENLKMFWLFRVCREPSPKARERYEKILRDTDKTYLIWKDDENFHFKPLSLEDSDTEIDLENDDL